ncbi:ANTAR domain-containing protein [Streptomyces cremeus]|uniref:ANTAR domain-containing response regulator n=1 Tax=Streptomyces cremeus TaxID=66881 RepID=A0ABV5PEA5_STRCM
MNREHRWLEASVRLAELMRAGPGPEPEAGVFLREFCRMGVELLHVPAVGAVLAEEGGAPRAAVAPDGNSGLLDLVAVAPDGDSGLVDLVAAAPDGDSGLLDLVAARCQDGPRAEGSCRDEPLLDLDLRAHAGRWPDFCARALAHGIDRVAVLPLRLRETRLGTWQVYGRDGLPAREELDMAQRLADIAVLSLVQTRQLSRLSRSADELRGALASRVAIEQAKGMLAARWGVRPDEAFQPMRSYARARRRKLREVAHDVIEGRLQLSPYGVRRS